MNRDELLPFSQRRRAVHVPLNQLCQQMVLMMGLRSVTGLLEEWSEQRDGWFST